MTKSKTYEVTNRTDEVGKVSHKAHLKAVQESEDGSDKESVYEVPLPPDGGWGWVVMIASFFINLIVDGVCYTFGVIFNGLLVTFGASETLTALVGSLVPGMYLIAGEQNVVPSRSLYSRNAVRCNICCNSYSSYRVVTILMTVLCRKELFDLNMFSEQ